MTQTVTRFRDRSHGRIVRAYNVHRIVKNTRLVRDRINGDNFRQVSDYHFIVDFWCAGHRMHTATGSSELQCWLRIEEMLRDEDFHILKDLPNAEYG